MDKMEDNQNTGSSNSKPDIQNGGDGSHTQFVFMEKRPNSGLCKPSQTDCIKPAELFEGLAELTGPNTCNRPSTC